MSFRLLLAFLLCTFQTHAKDPKTLKVFTYKSFTTSWGPGTKLKKTFERNCECKLVWVTAPDAGQLLTQLKIKKGKVNADVILGLDTHQMKAAEQLKAVTRHDIASAKQSPYFKSMGSSPYFIPVDVGFLAFIFNQERVKQIPKSLDDLLSDKNNWELIIQNPKTSTPGISLLYWLRQVYRDKSTYSQKLTKLKKKAKIISKSWSDAYALFLKGEADAVLSYTTSEAYHIENDKTQKYKAAHFREGHYMQTEVAGILRNARENKLAADFLRYLTQPKAQEIIASQNWMYPAFPHKAVELPKSYQKISKPKRTLLTSPQSAVQQSKIIMDAWKSTR